ncbi:MAG: LysR family transcriptional regulator, partial [Gammaproteobacteria bacterium]|nr:LysR family transcriptional regulator [Gammaproteobacteria bacterium]
VHKLDLVLSDRPIPTGLNVKAYSHLLGESAVSFFAVARDAKRFARRFPHSLTDAPLLLPINTGALRRKLDDWFDRIGVTPRVIAEFDDSALLKAFGEAGVGLFPGPSAIAAEIEHTYRARAVGIVDGVKEAYYAISPERKLKHPAVLAITQQARADLFRDSPRSH